MFGKIAERRYWLQIQNIFNLLIFKKTKTKRQIGWNSTQLLLRKLCEKSKLDVERFSKPYNSLSKVGLKLSSKLFCESFF